MRLMAQALLVFSGVIFTVYALACWYNPALPAGLAGISITRVDGYADIASMYGGVQLAVGMILTASAILKGYLRPGVWLLFFVITLVALSRATFALRSPESLAALESAAVAIDPADTVTVYTWAALAFETTLALLSGFWLWRNPDNRD